MFYIIICTITLAIYDITCFTEHDKPEESDSSEQGSPKEQKIRKLDQRPGKMPREKLSASEGVFEYLKMRAEREQMEAMAKIELEKQKIALERERLNFEKQKFDLSKQPFHQTSSSSKDPFSDVDN